MKQEDHKSWGLWVEEAKVKVSWVLKSSKKLERIYKYRWDFNIALLPQETSLVLKHLCLQDPFPTPIHSFMQPSVMGHPCPIFSSQQELCSCIFLCGCVKWRQELQKEAGWPCLTMQRKSRGWLLRKQLLLKQVSPLPPPSWAEWLVAAAISLLPERNCLPCPSPQLVLCLDYNHEN